MKFSISYRAISIFCAFCATSSNAFESTKVLPQGVRSFTLKTARSTINQKSESNGSLVSIAKPLAKDLTFKKILQGEEGLKKIQLEAFLLNEGFNLDSSLGVFSADMQGRVEVVAPIISYGLSENLSLAIAVPYYQAKMGVELGFTPQANARRFVERMHAPAYNLTQSAREASDKINHAVRELNQKLRDNGYRQLGSWQGRGMGDATIGAKYRFMDAPVLKLASSHGFVLPTGKQGDPDILNDIPFGKGTLDFFNSILIDEELFAGIFLNQYLKYTYSFDSHSRMRMVTEEEAIEVERRNVESKQGDRYETGISVQYEPAFGLLAGLGYVYSRKMSDRYEIPADVEAASAVTEKLQADTAQKAHHLEGKIGYSGVPAYKRGELPAPFSISLEYKKHLASMNSFSNDLIALDIALYF